MHIVITRPKEDSLHLIGKLRGLGHLTTHLPVIKIEKLKTKKKVKEKSRNVENNKKKKKDENKIKKKIAKKKKIIKTYKTI